MLGFEADWPAIILAVFLATQALYFLSLAVDGYLFSLPVNWVDVEEARRMDPRRYPRIVLFYPVLRELEETMRTTFLSLSEIDYPTDKYCVVAIPNVDDKPTVESLRRLQKQFPFLHIVEVPPTSHPSWQPVWDSWQSHPKAYWWHQGSRRHVRDLPPKKTRQLIYAFYNIAARMQGRGDFLVNYIDADSCPPRDHFLAAAAGIQHYDVLQATNVAGNLNASMAASWHAFDHMAWDGMKYPHLSADGKQPYWVLGKGLFFRASDLVALGGFNPWITIEDPEVGMRFWTNGKRLGVIANPLVEEVPNTIMGGITQRKRWICGFFQSLGAPLRLMGMTRWQRFKAWLNFVPCLSLSTNSIGLPFGVWVGWRYLDGRGVLPEWTLLVAGASLTLSGLLMLSLYRVAWKRTALVLDSFWARVWYMIRVNPLSLMAYWILWLVPLAIGLRMYLRDGGLVWERTEKVDANHDLVRSQIEESPVLVRLERKRHEMERQKAA